MDSMYCQYKDDLCTIPSSCASGGGLFFAYPSTPKQSAEAIEGAIRLLSQDETINVGLISWKDLPIEGNIIFCEICEAIRKSSCVVLNSTSANFNVLFEYGYAIGTGRAIWPLVEEGILKQDRLYTSLETLTTIGYSGFTNSRSIYKKILKKKPWKRSSSFDLPEPLGRYATKDTLSVLYLQSVQDSEASLRITEALSAMLIDVIADDPKEIVFHPLSWYLSRIKKSNAVIVHLGSARHENYILHSAKCALIAGIALAVGRKVLIMGENISIKPIDYRDLMKSYESASQADKLTREFINPIKTVIYDLRKFSGYEISRPKKEGDLKGNLLKAIDLGDYIAENEEESLNEYFVETPQFLMAFEPEFKVFVGRKGSGKTANFYMIMDKILEDKRNTVCRINPKDWQLDELLDFIKHELSKAKKGYLLESLWKYMIYSELIKTCYVKIKQKPESANFSPYEEEIINNFEKHKDFFQLSFTSRLIETVRALVKVYKQSKDESLALSEILHQKDIILMHNMIIGYLGEIKGCCTIVIDGLDANWYLGEDYQMMSDILLSLISSSRDMWRTCKRDLHKIKVDNGMSIFIFLRNDVFKVVIGLAKEPDKLQYELLLWANFEELFEIINRRIITSLTSYNIDTLQWEEILEPVFTPVEMKSFIKDNIIWRPRDIIYLFERALYFARSRHSKYLGKRDFEGAMGEYSDYAFRSLSAESQPYIPDMEDLILEFGEGKSILNLGRIRRKLLRVRIKEPDIRKAVNFLIETNFLGYEIQKDDFRFPITPTESTLMAKTVWNGMSENVMSRRRFKIHNAFHNALLITG